MPLLNLRSLVQFPSGDNASATLLNGVIFNRTALDEFGYRLYENKTLSNDSNCYLIFDNFRPSMLNNGTFINATTCYIPYYGIGTRGKTSIVFGVLFGLSIMFTLMNLKKHGQLHLREDKRFRVIGRRWQWYWMLFVAVCGMISTLTGVDVDRYYLQQIPIILQSFFFMLMVPGALAMVWEGTRHWGSWQERQRLDEDVYGMPQDDRRARTEFWLPLVFYALAWINFFLTIPRSWTPLQKQNTPEQIDGIARPAGTDVRTKVGAIIAVAAWMVTIFSLSHSLKHYRLRSEVGLFGKIRAFCRDCPNKLLINLALLAVRLGYGIASAWLWDLSIFQDNVTVGWPFGLGYAPILLIIVVFEIAGLLETNEDKTLINQRIARGHVHNAELNITKKPSWWSRAVPSRFQSDDERLRSMAQAGAAVAGPRPSARRPVQTMEMGDMTVRQRSSSRPAADPFRDESPPQYSEVERTGAQRLAVPRVQSDAASATTGRTLASTESAGTNVETAPQQRIRSMLDV